MSERHEINNGTDWFAVPCDLLFDESLTKFEKLVWLNFAAHLNRKTGACFPSAETQAREIGCSKEMVKKSRVSLIARGWLSKENIRNEAGHFIRWQWTIIRAESEGRRDPPSVTPTDGKTDRGENMPLTEKNINQKKIKPEEVKQKAPAASADASAALASRRFEDPDPMTLDEFIAWCEKSTQRHIEVIGSWAKTTSPHCTTKGQWRAFIKRHLRAARDLSAFSDKQLASGFSRLAQARDEGWLHKYSLETLFKFVVDNKATV